MPNSNKQIRRAGASAGFTLIEIMVVVAIIAILGAAVRLIMQKVAT